VFAAAAGPAAPAAREQPTLVIDSTVWRVLPRMTWAFWRAGRGEDNAIRMHVQFDLQRRSVAAVEVDARESLRAGPVAQVGAAW